MTAAERQRRWRERRQAGRFCVAIEISQELIDGLTDSGHLAQWNDTDPQAIGAAVVAAAREYVTRLGDRGGQPARVCDDQPVGSLVRSLAAAIPPDANAERAVRIILSELEHYVKPIAEKAVIKCRQTSAPSKNLAPLR